MSWHSFSPSSLKRIIATSVIGLGGVGMQSSCHDSWRLCYKFYSYLGTVVTRRYAACTYEWCISAYGCVLPGPGTVHTNMESDSQPRGRTCPESIYCPGQVVTSSYTVQGRSLLRFTPCSLVMKFLLPSISLTHLVRVVPTGRHFPLFPKILRSLRYQSASKSVRPWCQPRLAQFLAKKKCRAAEFSEYFEVSRLSRWTFFGTVFAPSHVLVPMVTSAIVFSMFPVLLAWQRETLDTLEAGTRAGSRAWHFSFVFSLFFFEKCLTEF